MPEVVVSARTKFPLSRWLGWGFSCCLLLGSLVPATQAADPAGQDKIILMQSSADGLMSDLEYMVKQLAKKQQQWVNDIEPNIELFLDGVDRSKPVRVDVFFDEKAGEYYRPAFPVSDLRAFRNNLDALGITSRPIASNLYLLESAFEGQMRMYKNYGVFAPKEWLPIIPAGLSAPEEEIKPLLDAKYDGAVLINNSANGVEKRKKSLAAIRANALAEVKKKSTESPDEYALRKQLAENQLDKLEQLYSEIGYLEAGWITDPKANQGLGTLKMSAIPGTVLHENFQKITQLKSRFTVVPEVEGGLATARVQLPISVRGKERLTSTYNAYLPVINKKIDDRDSLNASQKTAAKQAVTKTIALLEKGFTLSMIDLFAELRPAAKAGKHEALVGVQLVDGRDVEEILALLPQISDKFQLKADTGNQAGFRFHEVTISRDVPPMLESLFGTPCKLQLATSDGLLLVGFGDNVADWLKQTAQTLSDSPEPQPLPEFIRMKGHMGPFVTALSKRKPNENRPQLRDMLVQGFSQGDDYIEMSDVMIGDQINGTMKAQPGLLRFLGLAVAKFAEENL